MQKLSVRSLAWCYQFVRQHPMGGYKMHHDHDYHADDDGDDHEYDDSECNYDDE